MSADISEGPEQQRTLAESRKIPLPEANQDPLHIYPVCPEQEVLPDSQDDFFLLIFFKNHSGQVTREFPDCEINLPVQQLCLQDVRVLLGYFH